jgi:hypothetical protein
MLNYQRVAIVDEAQHFGEIAEVASLFPAAACLVIFSGDAHQTPALQPRGHSAQQALVDQETRPAHKRLTRRTSPTIMGVITSKNGIEPLRMG